MRTLLLNPNYEVKMDFLAPAARDPLGQGNMLSKRAWSRGRHSFTLRAQLQIKEEAEALYEWYQYHQGDTAFRFDGAQWGKVERPMFFGYGDGDTTDFFLPRRNIYPSSWITYENRIAKTDWTVISQSEGSIHYETAPAENAELTGKGWNWFPCLFFYEQEKAFTSSEFYHRLFGSEGIELREV
jgi:hypothetical protein